MLVRFLELLSEVLEFLVGDVLVQRLAGDAFEAPFKESPRQGRFRHYIGHGNLLQGVLVDIQDGLQDLLVVRGESGRGHPAHDLDRFQHDVVHRGGRIRDELFHERRRLPAAFLNVDLDAGQGGAAQAAQRLVIVHPHHGYFRRNLDAEAVAGLNEVGALVVVAGHDGDGLREALEPFVQPVALVVPDHRDLLHPVGVEGAAEAGGFHFPPEALAAFV